MAEDIRAVARAYLDGVWVEGRVELDDVVAPGFVGRTVGRPLVEGRAALKQHLAAILEAFSDREFTIDDMIAEGDKVAVRWTLRCTHEREIMGIAATGKRIETTGTTIYRIADGQ